MVGLAVTIGFAMALSGCTTDSPGDDESPAEPAFDGALVVLTEAGSQSVNAPARSPYYYTHGFLICRDGAASGDEVPVLRSVTYNETLKPLDVQPVIRRIPKAAERKPPGEGWTPIMGLLGKPGAFDNFVVRGEFSDDFDGTKVTASCDDAQESDSAKMELDVVMKVPKAGSDIDGFTISYDIGSETHKVRVPWRMVGCGTEADREMCGPPPS